MVDVYNDNYITNQKKRQAKEEGTMNKQEVIDKLKAAIPDKTLDDYQRVEEIALTYALELVEELGKVTVPQFVADWIEWCKNNNVTLLGAMSPIDELGTAICDDKKVKSLDASKWATQNQETFAKAWLFGYEFEKEKLYRAKNRHTGEYLCYCFGFFHDKNSSSENKRFTAEEKRWKELGYWDNDLYIFEEAEGEDEDE